MKRACSFTALVLLFGVLGLSAQAQDAAKKDTAIKPAPSPSQSVLDSWNDVGRKLIAMAEDFPEDKYDYKPNPSERTFAEQLLHAAGANYFFTNLANGEKPPAEEDPAAAIKAKGDAGMTKTVTDPESHQQVRVGDLAYGFIEHSGEHYGQLAVYYRTAGMVPPESRPKK
jgi:uncharacterized damage-inducible protein DinB